MVQSKQDDRPGMFGVLAAIPKTLLGSVIPGSGSGGANSQSGQPAASTPASAGTSASQSSTSGGQTPAGQANQFLWTSYPTQDGKNAITPDPKWYPYSPALSADVQKENSREVQKETTQSE